MNAAARGRPATTTRTAVLVRRQRVMIGDVSRRGCRFDAQEPWAIGDVGMLSVTIDGQVHVELFRVARTSVVPGPGGRYVSGVEFLPMPAGGRSLHDVAATLDLSSR